MKLTAADGKSYNTQHYSLSAIIAVGYKVNSELFESDFDRVVSHALAQLPSSSRQPSRQTDTASTKYRSLRKSNKGSAP